jgi:zinc/manganese transport system ATP-binding protein/zinc transport system ATP-binding protein
MLHIKGPNGVGKSTFIKGLLGMRGVLQGALLRNLDSSAIAYMPQQQNSSFHLPMSLEDLLLIAHGESFRTDYTYLLDSHQWPLAWNTASGGERKRALLLRSLLYHPKVLILDEPYNHLDKESCRKITKALGEFLQRDSQRSLVMITHEDQYLDAIEGVPVDVLDLEQFGVVR